MKTVQIDGYSHWALFLINGDDSGLCPYDFAELEQWLKFHNVDAGSCLDCTGEEFFGLPDGPSGMLKGSLLTYTFAV